MTFDPGIIIREEWKPVSEYLKENIGEQDIVIIDSRRPFSYYYDKNCFTSSDIHNCLKKSNIFSIANVTNLYENGKLSKYPVWLIVRSKSCINNEAYPYLSKNNKLVFEKNYRGVDICYFKNS